VTAIGAILWTATGWVSVGAAAVLATVGVAYTVWTYRGQARAVPAVWRWVMVVLKSLALVGLALSVLKPVAVRPESPEEAGAVAVLIDASRSMSAVDGGRSPAERVELADALGRLPEGARPRLLPGVLRALHGMAATAEAAARAGAELDYAKLTGRGAEVAQARFDELGRQLAGAGTDIASRVGGAEGLAEAVRPLAHVAEMRERAGWPAEVAAAVERATVTVARARERADGAVYEQNADVRRASDAVAALTRSELVAAMLTRDAGLLGSLPAGTPVFGYVFSDGVRPVVLRKEGRPYWPADVAAAGGDLSDITGAVREALARTEGRRLQAVVVLTDGRQVGGDPVVASNLAAAGVPVFPVLAAGATRDLAVGQVTMPTGVYLDEVLNVGVRVRAPGFRGMPVEVQLRTEGVTQNQIVRVGDGDVADGQMHVRMDAPGLRKLTVGAGTAPGEASLLNNEVDRWVKVIPAKLKVAVLTGTPGWDFQYLRNAVVRSPWVEASEAVLPPGAVLGMSAEQLLAQDVVVLDDVSVASLDLSQWDALHRLVTDKGGSVVLGAGDAHLPAEYTNDAMLADLLPYRGGGTSAVWRTWAGEEAYFRVVPSAAAEGLDVLRLDGPTSTAAVAAQWSRLPALYRYLQLPALKPNTKALVVERETGAPVLTESRLGAGRTFMVCINETWRWRYKTGEAEQDRFWLQLLRYAAEEPYLVNGPGWAFDVDRPQVHSGERVRVRAKSTAAAAATRPAGALQASVVRDGVAVETVPMTSAGPGRYEAVLPNLAPGEYVVRLGGAGQPMEIPLRVTGMAEEELSDLTGDESILKRLAEVTGGEVVPLASAGELLGKITEHHQSRPHVVERRLWDSPWLYAFVLGCLGAEWGLRKRFGLA
jgi:hypothetical protein